jgi:hypothetical protein
MSWKHEVKDTVYPNGDYVTCLPHLVRLPLVLHP